MTKWKTNTTKTALIINDNKFLITPENAQLILDNLNDDEYFDKIFQKCHNDRARRFNMYSIIVGLIWGLVFIVGLGLYLHLTWKPIILFCGIWALLPTISLFFKRSIDTHINRYFGEKCENETYEIILSECRDPYKNSTIDVAIRSQLIENLPPRVRDNIFEALEDGKTRDQELVDRALLQLGTQRDK